MVRFVRSSSTEQHEKARIVRLFQAGPCSCFFGCGCNPFHLGNGLCHLGSVGCLFARRLTKNVRLECHRLCVSACFQSQQFLVRPSSMNVCHRWSIVFFVYFGCKFRQVLVSVRWSPRWDQLGWAGPRHSQRKQWLAAVRKEPAARGEHTAPSRGERKQWLAGVRREPAAQGEHAASCGSDRKQ